MYANTPKYIFQIGDPLKNLDDLNQCNVHVFAKSNITSGTCRHQIGKFSIAECEKSCGGDETDGSIDSMPTTLPKQRLACI